MLARRTLSVLFALLACVTVLAAPASAAPNYPPGRPPSIELPSTTVVPGESVVITFPNWMAKAPIVVTVGRPNGPQASQQCGPGRTCTVVANAKGTGQATMVFAQAGRYTITARGRGADGKVYSLSATLTVANAVAAKAKESGLAQTGTDLTTLWAGVGLLFAGALLVSVSRARRRITV